MKKKGKIRKKEKKFPTAPVLISVLLFVLAIILYANTLEHEFVFDDATLILQNPTVFRLDVWRMISGSGYRPVRGLTYIFNYYLGGDDPSGYHLFNVVLHGFNVVVLAWFAFALTRSRRISGIAALIFCIHPVQTAAVAYISGRKDLLALFFLLIGLLLFLRFRRNRSGLVLVFSFCSFILAVASKEVALVFPVLLILVDAVIVATRSERPPEGGLSGALLQGFRQARTQYAVFGLAALAGLTAALFIQPASRMEGFWGGNFLNNLGTSFKLFAHYLKLTVFPHPLIADYSGHTFPVSTGPTEVATLLAVAVAVAFAVLVVWLFPRNPIISFGLGWLAVTLLPVLQLIPFHELAADHFLYLPLVGFSIAVGGLADRLLSLSRKPALVWVPILLLATISGWVVINRNKVWRDPKTLWTTTLEQAPESYRANANLAQILMQEGQAERAIELMRKSLEIDPSQAVSWTNLGFVHYQIGRQARQAGRWSLARENQDSAIRNFTQALELNPKDPILSLNLGSSYAEMYRIFRAQNRPDLAQPWLEKAKETYRKVLVKSRTDKRRELLYVRRNLAGLFLDSDRPHQAIRQLRVYLEEQPEDPTALYLMGEAYRRLNRYRQAAKYLEKAVELNATTASLQALGEVYDRLDRSEDALEAFQKAVESAPGSPDLRFRLAMHYKKRGDVYFAIKEFQQVNRLDRTGRYGPLVAREIRNLTLGQN